jgi:hypothetical protein
VVPQVDVLGALVQNRVLAERDGRFVVDEQSDQRSFLVQ